MPAQVHRPPDILFSIVFVGAAHPGHKVDYIDYRRMLKLRTSIVFVGES